LFVIRLSSFRFGLSLFFLKKAEFCGKMGEVFVSLDVGGVQFGRLFSVSAPAAGACTKSLKEKWGNSVPRKSP
jgi:hypothetical protein